MYPHHYGRQQLVDEARRCPAATSARRRFLDRHAFSVLRTAGGKSGVPAGRRGRGRSPVRAEPIAVSDIRIVCTDSPARDRAGGEEAVQRRCKQREGDHRNPSARTARVGDPSSSTGITRRQRASVFVPFTRWRVLPGNTHAAAARRLMVPARPLPIPVPLVQAETLESYLSRLVTANHSTRAICPY